MAELVVTNFNRNFTGVSATAANVVAIQRTRYDMVLAGVPLPGCPDPVSLRAARAATRTPPAERPFAIWHVRRNTEMRAALWARDVLRLPIRIVFTSAAQRRHSAFPRWLISRMDAVIATTEEAAGFVPHVRAVVPHGVDTSRFAPAPDRAAAWAALGYGGKRGIATIGRVRPEKGTDIFVETMLRALPDMPDVTALVIGRAASEHRAFEENLKARAAAAGLGERLRFIGEMPADDLPSLMPALSAVVQLPRYEGYGMVPLEAMASATPFVGSETGYFHAFSAQGQTGTVVPREQPDAAAAALHAMLSVTDRHAVMARAAREAAETHFSAKREADGIGAVYDALWCDT
jgi:mannosyltransferase